VGARRLLASAPRGRPRRRRLSGHRGYDAPEDRAPRRDAVRRARRERARRLPRDGRLALDADGRHARAPELRVGPRRARHAHRAARAPVGHRAGHAVHAERGGRGGQHGRARGPRRAQAPPRSTSRTRSSR
jgi:hypothetical protein